MRKDPFVLCEKHKALYILYISFNKEMKNEMVRNQEINFFINLNPL